MHLSASSQLRAVALRDPDRPAIVARDRRLSYAELDRAVDLMAAWLLADRTPDDQRVVVLRFRETVPLVVSSLAIARAGLVSAMLDPTAPPERVDLLLGHLAFDGGWVLVTDEPDDIGRFAYSTLFDDARKDPGGLDLDSHEADVDDLQNIIFTSGSTGSPVGLCVSGRQREAIDGWMRTFDAFKEGARVGAISAGTMGQSSEFPRIVIATGATIVVHDVLVDGLDTIPAWLRDERVEAVGLVPTLVRFLLPLMADQLGPDGLLPALMTVALWGEQPDWDSAAGLARHLPPGAVIHNAYATTETGLIAALALTPERLDRSDHTTVLPAGRPLPGVEVLVVDAAGQPVQTGTAGEILVSSPHLAQGHWRRPDLTRMALTTRDGATYWRTGDGGYVDESGTLHVQGRLDDIVKINGHRISLGELEQAAREQQGVAAAAAVAREDAVGSLRLHLFAVSQDDAVDPRWLRARLARVLPPAALPDTVRLVGSLPILGNGKLDRSALPEVSDATDVPVDGSTFAARVSTLVAQVLERPSMDLDDDFFAHGGDSIRAGRLVALLQTQLGHYVPASLVLEAPTPRMLAAALTTSEPSIIVPIRTEGAGAPLFVIHGSGADVWFAQPLSEQLDDRPVYGIRPPPLVGPTPFAPTLQAVAEAYVAEIRRVRPTGPYQLFGYSMGGIIAVEIATLLQDLGEEVELLALGDSHPPERMAEVWLELRAARERERPARRERMNARYVLRHGPRRVRWKLRSMRDRRLWRAFEAGHEPAPDIRDPAYERVYGTLAVEHRMRTTFRGDLTLITATQEPGTFDHGWGSHVDGSVRVVPVDTNHLGLLVDPHLREVCQALVLQDR